MSLEVFQGKFIKIFSGAIEEKGQKLTLRMTDKSDLARDILTVNIFSDFLFYIPKLCDIYFFLKKEQQCSFYVVFIQSI